MQPLSNEVSKMDKKDFYKDVFKKALFLVTFELRNNSYLVMSIILILIISLFSKNWSSFNDALGFFSASVFIFLSFIGAIFGFTKGIYGLYYTNFLTKKAHILHCLPYSIDFIVAIKIFITISYIFMCIAIFLIIDPLELNSYRGTLYGKTSLIVGYIFYIFVFILSIAINAYFLKRYIFIGSVITSLFVALFIGYFSTIISDTLDLENDIFIAILLDVFLIGIVYYAIRYLGRYKLSI